MFEIERAQLAGTGHVVESVELDNLELRTAGIVSRLEAGLETVWSSKGAGIVRRILERFKPDVLHVHNFFPQMSPRIYYLAAAARVPVVQTLHNFRLLCANGTFLRAGRVCEECVPSRFYRGLIHGCYRHSVAASAAVVAMQYTHHLLGTFGNKVDRYIALTNFARERFIAGGLPAERIVVKPNSLAEDPGYGPGDASYALFVGRLSPEKGVRTLLAAWRQVPGLELRLAGDGPLRGEIERQANQFNGQVKVLGALPPHEVYTLLKRARFLIVPSEWYEGFPMTIIESYACGTPVLAARIGSLAEVVTAGETGLHFEPGNSTALAQAVITLNHDSRLPRTMRYAARQRFEKLYTAAHNVKALEVIYEGAMRDSRQFE